MRAKIKQDCGIYGLSVPVYRAGQVIEVTALDTDNPDYFKDEKGWVFNKDLLELEESAETMH